MICKTPITRPLCLLASFTFHRWNIPKSINDLCITAEWLETYIFDLRTPFNCAMLQRGLIDTILPMDIYPL